jgi:hypothetical protein
MVLRDFVRFSPKSHILPKVDVFHKKHEKLAKKTQKNMKSWQKKPKKT